MAKKMFTRDNKSSSTQTSSKNVDLHAKIQKKAYELFEKRGYNNGSDLADWLEAERIVKSQLR